MKLLFDQNLSFKLCSVLDDLFPGSGHVRLLGLAESDDVVVFFEQDTNASCLEIV